MLDTYDTHNPLNPVNRPETNSEWDLESSLDHAEKNLLKEPFEVIKDEISHFRNIYDLARTLIKKQRDLEHELSIFGHLSTEERLELNKTKKKLYKLFK